jgi:hypothetical protein
VATRNHLEDVAREQHAATFAPVGPVQDGAAVEAPDSGVVIRLSTCGEPAQEEDADVKRVNVFDAFDLGAKLATLSGVLGRPPLVAEQLYWSLVNAEALLNRMLRERAFQGSLQEARHLRNLIIEALFVHFLRDIGEGKTEFRPDLNWKGTVDDRSFPQLRSVLNGFWHVFQADCRGQETHIVENMPGLNVSDLLNRARVRINEAVLPLVPEAALVEMDWAGRCWAFRCFTATGFHALRAIELVIDHYLRARSGKEESYSSWYDYVSALAKIEPPTEDGKRATSKVGARVRDLKDLDRNPLMHPGFGFAGGGQAL